MVKKMVLSSKTIKNLVEDKSLIKPFDEDNLSSNSYDLTLADSEGTLELAPGESKLVVTKDTVNLPLDIVAKTVSKSSFARLGVSIGDIGGHVDAGFRGQLTLLAVNLSNKPFKLSKTNKITQIVFLKSDQQTDTPYNGHYQDSVGKVNSWMKEK